MATFFLFRIKKGALTFAAVLGSFILAAGIILGWYGFPFYVRQKIKEGVVLRPENSEFYSRWKKIPQVLDFKIYFWNVTNPREIERGARPILEEIGPYVYDQYREKYQIEHHLEDDTVSYKQNFTFFFNQQKTGDLKESDLITVLNAPLLGAVSKVKREFGMFLGLMQKTLDTVFPGSDSVFRTAAAGDLLFYGVDLIDCRGSISEEASMICSGANSMLPDTVILSEPGLYKFSFFGFRNYTDNGFWNVKRGSVFEELGQVMKWNGNSKLDIWSGDSCNAIKGTDGTIFPPNADPKNPIQKMFVFAPEVCRTFDVIMDDVVSFNGINVIRYVNSPTMFESGDNFEENKCFCNDDGCLDSGVMDIEPCRDQPVIISFPHFYNASEKYLQYPQGLNPNKTKHETFALLEPLTGAPIGGARRMQLNMFLFQEPQIKALVNVSEGLFPILWMDEGVIIDSKNFLILAGIFSNLFILEIVKWIIIGSGAALTALAILLLISRKSSGFDKKINLDSRYNGVAISRRNNHFNGNKNSIGITDLDSTNGCKDFSDYHKRNAPVDYRNEKPIESGFY